jgi:hypothetical protein
LQLRSVWIRRIPRGRSGWRYLLSSLHRHAEAVAVFEQVLALVPLEYAHHHALASALLSINRFSEALAGFETAIALRPDAVENHLGRGEALRRLCSYEDALNAYDQAISIQKDCAAAWYGKALLLLLMGRYEDGWPLHEWRWFTPDYPEPQRLFRQPFWDRADLAGRTLLVHSEQGLGDSIQFYRFMTLVRQQGPVALVVPPRLARLFATQPNAPEITTHFNQLPRHDLHCPMMSLPFLLGRDLNTIPAAPYLRADPRIAASWLTRLPHPPGRPRVGIVWTGNDKNLSNASRSMPLATMLSMLVPDLIVISLQMGVPASDVATLQAACHVLDLSESQDDFADTAAVISHLDLVISVDTSVAHLPGAMCVPVWVLLSAPADWRWLLDREDSPWYSSARLFRQHRSGDWSDVARQVREALQRMTGST